jgi:hypothetical protein
MPGTLVLRASDERHRLLEASRSSFVIRTAIHPTQRGHAQGVAKGVRLPAHALLGLLLTLRLPALRPAS